MTLEASGLWLGTQTEAGGTATLFETFLAAAPMAPWTAGSSTNEYVRKSIKLNFFLIVLLFKEDY